MKFSIFPHLVFSYCPGAGLRHSNSLMLRLMAGIERHRSIHRLDSTVVCTACRDRRKERMWWRSSSGRALNRSGAEPPPARARLGAASISIAATPHRSFRRPPVAGAVDPSDGTSKGEESTLDAGAEWPLMGWLDRVPQESGP